MERIRVTWGKVEFRVTSRKSRLYHQDAIAQRLRTYLHDSAVTTAPDDSEAPAAGQLITVRLFRDHCTVSVDSSGDLLHRRGYRLATAKAPLRETLGAAMLLAAGWDGTAPLLDPMCGSGTIPIEAALLARRIAPGLHRRFAFEDWPGFDAEAWQRLREKAVDQVRPAAPVPILGSDRDEGAVAAAVANAERAGVARDIEFQRAAISAIDPPGGQPVGWSRTRRTGFASASGSSSANLYAQLGNVARRRCPGGGLRCSRPTGAGAADRLPFERVFETVRMAGSASGWCKEWCPRQRLHPADTRCRNAPVVSSLSSFFGVAPPQKSTAPGQTAGYTRKCNTRVTTYAHSWPPWSQPCLPLGHRPTKPCRPQDQRGGDMSSLFARSINLARPAAVTSVPLVVMLSFVKVEKSAPLARRGRYGCGGRGRLRVVPTPTPWC